MSGVNKKTRVGKKFAGTYNLTALLLSYDN